MYEKYENITLEEIGKFELYTLRDTTIIKNLGIKKLGYNEFYLFCHRSQGLIKWLGDLTRCDSYTICKSEVLEIFLTGFKGPYLRREDKFPNEYAPADKIVSGEVFNIYLKMLSSFRCQT